MRTECRKSLWNWRSDLPERVWIEEGGLFERKAGQHLQTAAMSWLVRAVYVVKVAWGPYWTIKFVGRIFFPYFWFMDLATGMVPEDAKLNSTNTGRTI